MNTDIEKEFVGRFIVKERRERLLFELGSRKRKDGIGRFCHGAEEILIKDKIALYGNDLFYDEILGYIRHTEKAKQCYIIAYNDWLDGISCPVENGLERILGNGMAAILIIGDTAVVETEQCFGTPERFVLHI